ncbi:hypothetical protein ABGF48_00805 [Helcococcus bovis]|uniref:hypothetical protein n=1 Tax=Helcococcus bovis TaxID=3153252 RepID=UPI0038BD6ED2
MENIILDKVDEYISIKKVYKTKKNIYKCPCRNSTICETLSNIPDEKPLTIQINCIKCRRVYKIRIDKASKKWKIMKRTPY